MAKNNFAKIILKATLRLAFLVIFVFLAWWLLFRGNQSKNDLQMTFDSDLHDKSRNSKPAATEVDGSSKEPTIIKDRR